MRLLAMEPIAQPKVVLIRSTYLKLQMSWTVPMLEFRSQIALGSTFAVNVGRIDGKKLGNVLRELASVRAVNE